MIVSLLLEFTGRHYSTYESVEGLEGVFVTEHHNHVLPLWCLAAEEEKSKLSIITFDSHTDTMSASDRAVLTSSLSLKNALAKQRRMVAQKNDLRESLWRLSNLIRKDEQIIEFNELRYMKRAMVVTRAQGVESYGLNDLHRHHAQIEYVTDPLDEDKRDKILQFCFNHMPFVLDIDLDYYTEPPNLSDELWRLLFERAYVVTIARESWFYGELCGENPFDVNGMLELLIDAMREMRAS